MEKLKQEVEKLLGQKYPGAKIYWDDDPLVPRLGGTLVWDGFASVTQLDRQRQLGAYLRGHLRDRATGLGLILTLTPQEREAILEPA
jgi:hypothetical protein